MDTIYDNVERGPIDSLKASMGLISGEVTKLNHTLQDSEYDIATRSISEEKVNINNLSFTCEDKFLKFLHLT